MFRYLLLLVTCFPFALQGQMDSIAVSGDSKYLEDQVYFGITYNFMLNQPADIFKRNFSYGLQGGFIKDLPINQERTFGFGIGLGYAANSYYSNLISSKNGNVITYAAATSDVIYNRSKFETHSIEIPIELRWRNSTKIDYKFFRVYAGVKLNYNFSARSKLASNDGNIGFQNTDIEKLQYGLQCNIGYNTFNVHIYYSLNNFLKQSAVMDNGNSITMQPLRIGLVFYML